MITSVAYFRHRLVTLGFFLSCAFVFGCAGHAAMPQSAAPNSTATFHVRRETGQLGPVIKTKHGGNVSAWAIDENGTDGILTESSNPQPSELLSYVETFDQTTDEVTKTVAKQTSSNGDDEYIASGILDNDVGLIDDEEEPCPGCTRNDTFDRMSPVTRGRFTGQWRLPNKQGILLQDVADQQSNPLEAIFVLDNNDAPALPEVIVSDVQHNKFKKTPSFPDGQIWYGPEIIAEDSETADAIVPTQYLQGSTLVFDDFDLKKGKVSTFLAVPGVGPFEGVAIDSSTDMMCTTTQGDYSVEFYSLKTRQGFAEQLPGAGGEQESGSSIAADPVNHLFLVTQPTSSVSPSGGSTVFVYDENGNLVETINGFAFGGRFSDTRPAIQVNAGKRVGFVNGSQGNEIQSFSY